MDWDAGTWRYRNNDNTVKMIEDDYIALNLKKNDPFILIFSKEIEERNNSSDTDINNSFIKVSTTSPLLLEYGEYVDIFSESKAR